MKNLLITFSGSVYENTTKKIIDNAPKYGVDEVLVYDDLWLTKQPFYEVNQWLWQHHHKRGFGWYAWKPFIILDALSRVNNGDIVMYLDADTFPIHDLSKLYEIADRDGAMFFASENHRQYEWCKADCYMVMNQNDVKYKQAPAGVARFMLFKKGNWKSYQFLMEWLTYCVNERATTFDPSIYTSEHNGFIEHRTEQAIMTNLCLKYGYKLHREACEAGNGINRDWDLYPQLFSQENDFAQKSGNITAPVLGSKFRNV